MGEGGKGLGDGCARAAGGGSPNTGTAAPALSRARWIEGGRDWHRRAAAGKGGTERRPRSNVKTRVNTATRARNSLSRVFFLLKPTRCAVASACGCVLSPARQGAHTRTHGVRGWEWREKKTGALNMDGADAACPVCGASLAGACGDGSAWPKARKGWWWANENLNPLQLSSPHTALPVNARHAHANACLDKASVSATAGPPRPPPPRRTPAPPATVSPPATCPVCNASFAGYGLSRRRAHVNACCDGAPSPGPPLAAAAAAPATRAAARRPPTDARPAERALLDALYPPPVTSPSAPPPPKRRLAPSAVAGETARSVAPAASLWRGAAAPANPVVDGAAPLEERVAARRAAVAAGAGVVVASSGGPGPDGGCGPPVGADPHRPPPCSRTDADTLAAP